MRILNRNPEEDQEYLEPGDRLSFLTDMSIYVFSVPGRTSRSGDYRAIVTAREGDMVEYKGISLSKGSKSPLYEFVFMPLDEEGRVIKKMNFFTKNVETIIKWTEIL